MVVFEEFGELSDDIMEVQKDFCSFLPILYLWVHNRFEVKISPSLSKKNISLFFLYHFFRFFLWNLRQFFLIYEFNHQYGNYSPNTYLNKNPISSSTGYGSSRKAITKIAEIVCFVQINLNFVPRCCGPIFTLCSYCHMLLKD